MKPRNALFKLFTRSSRRFRANITSGVQYENKAAYFVACTLNPGLLRVSIWSKKFTLFQKLRWTDAVERHVHLHVFHLSEPNKTVKSLRKSWKLIGSEPG
jgi:hypothetical protein